MLKNLLQSYWFVFFLSVLGLQAYSQDPSANVVVSPSPSSASIARYSEVPVDLSTGVPQISIPLHVIESTQLSHSISISYHASGIKVDDVAGPVGTGWSLNAGGMINRIMRNRPDEQPNGFFTFAAAIPNETDALTLSTKKDLAARVTDMMPDLFYFSTGAMAGKLIFDNQLIPRSIPQNTLKIATSSTSTLATFTFADPSGTNYEFEAGESATSSYLRVPGASATYISSWYLKRIVSADKTDTIKFNYTSFNSYTYKTSVNSGLNFFYNAPQGSSRYTDPVTNLSSNVFITVSGTRYLSSIEHSGGKVTFAFSGGRTDDADGQKLDKLVIYDKDPVLGTYVENKQIHFSYSYFQNTNSGTRLRLDGVREQLNATTFNPPYTFAYSTKQLPAPSSPAQDHWGYYNGAETNTGLIPAYTHMGIVVSTNNREVNPNFADGCMLKSITSPLTGVTEFIFEQNKYLNGTVDAHGPGLRIQKIIKRDPFSNIAAITDYEYRDPVTGKSSGRLMNSPNYFTQLDVVDNTHGTNYYYNCLLIKVNANSIGNFSGAPVIYEYVTTYMNSDVNSAGKTVSKFSTYQAPSITFPYFPVDDNAWDAGDLKTQEVYKVQGGVSTIVKKIENTYELSPHSFTIKGLSCTWNKVFLLAPPTVNDFFVENYFTYSKFRYLKESKVYDYEQNSGTIKSVGTQTNYYDKSDVHLFPTKTEWTTSISSEKIKQEYAYVADGPSTGVNAVMKNLNMTGLTLEKTSYVEKNGTDFITGYQATEYFEWTPGKVYAKNFYTGKLPVGLSRTTFKASPGTYTTLDSRVNTYSQSGIALETEVIGDQPKSIIVDKQLNRVVASADVASASQIAYTSFESGDFGNWNVDAGTSTSTINEEVGYNNTSTTIFLQNSQTINYSYSITSPRGPGAHLIFTQSGVTPVDKYIFGSTGNGSTILGPGTWSVTLTYESNITDVTVDFSYQYTSSNPPSIVTAYAKTGQRSIQLGSVQTISKHSLPPGSYTVVYYQRGGTATLTSTGGATVLSTVASPMEADGWTKVQKEIQINGTSQGIQITGTSSIYIDELRLYPSGSFMTTTCYDIYKNVNTKTDVNLRSQFIEYDERRRVKVVRDHAKNILQHYDYKLAAN